MLLMKSLYKTILAFIITINMSSISFANNISSKDININYQNSMTKPQQLSESTYAKTQLTA